MKASVSTFSSLGIFLLLERIAPVPFDQHEPCQVQKVADFRGFL
jgi:hypothetical protein